MPTITLKNVPAHLHKKLKGLASKHRRSLNQEALYCLENAVLSSRAADPDDERDAWLAQSARRLASTWDNQADDVYNELLQK